MIISYSIKIFWASICILTIATCLCNANSNDIQKMVEEAGCPYIENSQLLMEYVCLMPNYRPYESPEDQDGKTWVDLDLIKAPHVLEIGEKENKITVQLVHLMEWEDPRIRINLSGMPDMQFSYSYAKIPRADMNRIWLPFQDITTTNLQKWESVDDPWLLHSVGINKCPRMRECQSTQNATSLFAFKRWRATLFCTFDFSLFPLDTQTCEFRQRFDATSDDFQILTYPRYTSGYRNNDTKTTGEWQYKSSGFEIIITPVGTIIDAHKDAKNTLQRFGFDMTLRRIIQPYLFQYYFPCIAIVLISQIGFMIPLSAIPGRVALVTTQFLTLTNIFISQTVNILLFRDATVIYCLSFEKILHKLK